mmetsp:Transcript_129513/g.414112  ORF Transcript_129513/g.414112 Transcript_129513/m.414112 type:complete len:211 (-) Transcript_129513:4181-4813(-)
MRRTCMHRQASGHPNALVADRLTCCSSGHVRLWPAARGWPATPRVQLAKHSWMNPNTTKAACGSANFRAAACSSLGGSNRLPVGRRRFNRTCQVPPPSEPNFLSSASSHSPGACQATYEAPRWRRDLWAPPWAPLKATKKKPPPSPSSATKVPSLPGKCLVRQSRWRMPRTLARTQPNTAATSCENCAGASKRKSVEPALQVTGMVNSAT